MVAAAQRGGQFCRHTVAVQKHFVVTGMGLLFLVAEPRAVVVWAIFALGRHGQDGQVQQVPVSLASVCEAVDLMVFVLIAGTGAVLGDRRQLHQRVGQGCTREGLGTPCTLLLGACVAEVIG